ncbi:MAG: arsenate reductase (glutaredoxin) [Bacteroidia bacterium]|nr:arsenate reductase (glutaredoxin) [Bacteroidia bacterium]MCZ2249483.1 arsenate reductase (glutaredoxin) [Bacteroidia bacterium]
MITIFHKNTCSTSRKVLDILKNSEKEYKIIEYMKTPPTADDIRSLVKKLNIPAEKLVRKKETLYKEKYADKNLTEEQYIEIMAQHPELIERPILVKGNKAVIGRPVEIVAEWLG